MGTPAPDALLRLVDRFDQDRKVFLSGDYKEEQLRLEFLNPFFTALGWDMDNRCEPDNSEFRTQRPECRTSGHSDFWFLIFDFCIIRFVNRQGLSETFKQVIHEESIKTCPERSRRVAGASKAPDYTFRIGGRRTFFVEAKKPAVNVAEDAGPARQLRRRVLDPAATRSY